MTSTDTKQVLLSIDAVTVRFGGLLFLMMRFSPGGMAALARRFFNPVSPQGGRT